MKRSLKPRRTVSAPRVAPRDQTTSAVLEAIDCITTVPHESIAVTVYEGWVRLEGTLPDWSQKETVDNIVRHVPGVKGLISLIQVTPFYPHNEIQL